MLQIPNKTRGKNASVCPFAQSTPILPSTSPPSRSSSLRAVVFVCLIYMMGSDVPTTRCEEVDGYVVTTVLAFTVRRCQPVGLQDIFSSVKEQYSR
jgi:hypothetical protein